MIKSTYIHRILFLLCISCFSPLRVWSQSPEWTIEVRGAVEENDKKLAGAVVSVYADNTLVNSITTPNGNFGLTLENDKNYIISFTKPGYITKRISFSTKNVPPERAKFGFSAYSDIEVNIFPEIPGTNVDQILMQPIGKIGYDATYHNGDFTYDAKYTQSIQSLLDKILQAQKEAEEKARELEAQYKKAIAKADGEFNAKDYDNAITDYTTASSLKPNEQYPKDQLAAITKAKAAAAAASADAAKKAAEQKATQAKYDSLVKMGDNAFKTKSYSNAKAAYNGALQVKPNEQYPKDQLAAIDKAMAADADAAKKAAIQAKYDSLVKAGDNAFKGKSYNNAKSAYNGALQVKPNEQYPKDQLAAIDKAMAADADAAKKAAMQAKYDSLVKIGDNAFKGKSYDNAKAAYNGALQVKPNEQYPKDQLAAIDKAMAADADAAKKAAQQKALQAKYDSLVKIGDGAFKTKSYSNAKAAYNAALQVKSNEQYPKDQLAAIDKAMAADADATRKAAIQAKYDSLVKAGDNAFKGKSYDNAKAAYNGALQVKPNEQYPKDQLTAIDKAISSEADAAKKAALQAKYDSLVKAGDNAFKGKSYDNAKAAYNGALQVKPNEQYPKDQLAAIDKAISSEADAAKKAALQAKYDSLIKIGDDAFKGKNYGAARSAYNGALQVKSAEKYPKDQLAAIDKALAADAEAAKKAAVQAKYDSLVKIGDDAFKGKNYNAAKPAYTAALQVKPNEKYPKDQLAAIDKAIAAQAAEEADAAKKAARQKAMQAKYDSLVKIGDAAFNGKSYKSAKVAYTSALEVKPDEQYPKDQLAAIDKALSALADASQKAAMQAKYDSLIKTGDVAFKTKDYNNAKDAYTSALQIKSSEPYPKNQLALIDKALADMDAAAKKDAQAKALQAKYDSLIKVGDGAFGSKDYASAKDAYNGALKIKPDQAYPKSQLAAIDKAMAADADAARKEALQKAGQRRYDSVIALADKAYNGKDYNSALPLYTKASQIRPAEQYPKDQIAAINKINTQKSSNDADYNRFISSGNQNYFMKNYQASLAAFKRASALKPNESLPKQRIKDIENILAQSGNQQNPVKDSANTDAVVADSIASKYSQGITEEHVDEPNCQITRRVVVKGKRGWIYTRKNWNFGTYYFKAGPPDYEDVTITEDTWNQETVSSK